MIFNPNIAQIEINPLVKLKEDAMRSQKDAKQQMEKIQKKYNRAKLMQN